MSTTDTRLTLQQVVEDAADRAAFELAATMTARNDLDQKAAESSAALRQLLEQMLPHMTLPAAMRRGLVAALRDADHDSLMAEYAHETEVAL